MKNAMKSSGRAPESTCAYTGTEADLYCEDGKYQFIGSDNKIYRITTTSDILTWGTIINPTTLSPVDQQNITTLIAAYSDKCCPPPCPKSTWWKPWLGRQVVVDLHPYLSGISIEMLTSDNEILQGEHTGDDLITFGAENRVFMGGLHKYTLRGELESGTNIIVEFEVNIKATVLSG